MGLAVKIALWRAHIKPPLEVVVDNLKKESKSLDFIGFKIPRDYKTGKEEKNISNIKNHMLVTKRMFYMKKKRD